MSNNEALVTIAIITYNQKCYIEEAVLSAVNQTYKNIEVLVCDDGSTDGTDEIIYNLEQKFQDIVRVVRGANLGITGNCNRAVENANGSFLVFMGGDDVLYKDKIHFQVQAFLKNPEIVLCAHELDQIDQNGKYIGKQVSPKNVKSGSGADLWIKYGMLAGAMSIMIRLPRESRHRVRFDSEYKYSSDLKYYIDCLNTKGKWFIINQPLGGYRKHDESITKSKWVACVEESELMFINLANEGTYNPRVIKYGAMYQVCYGRALRDMEEKRYLSASRQFFKVISSQPLIFKAYIRIFQLLVFKVKDIVRLK